MIKKEISAFFALTFLFTLLTLSPSIFVSAQNFEVVEVKSVRDSVTFNQPALYKVIIKNSQGYPDTFTIVSLQTSFDIPTKTIIIPAASTESTDIEVFPLTKRAGHYNVRFYVKSEQTRDNVETAARVNLIDLSKILVFKIKPEKLDRGMKNATLVVQNIANVEVPSTVKFKGAIDSEIKFILHSGVNEIPFAADFEKVEGGKHTLELSYFEGETLSFKRKLQLEVNRFPNIEERKESSGLLVRETKIILENTGNVAQDFVYTIPLTFFDRTFTSFIPQPEIERDDDKVLAKWAISIKPGEELELIARTNYSAPLVALFVLFIVIFLTATYSIKPVSVHKKVIRIMTNRGMAYKVMLSVVCKNTSVSNIVLRDPLPHLVKLHEKFETVKPDRVTPNSLIWNLGNFVPGEGRAVSYILHSEVEVIGALQVPQAVVSYTVGGKNFVAVSESTSVFS